MTRVLIVLIAFGCFSGSAATAIEPLTLSHVAHEESLTIVVDFDPEIQRGVIQQLVDFWEVQGSVKDVVVVSTSDLSRKTSSDLARGNIVLYGTFETREDNPVFLALRGTWIGALLEKKAPHFADGVGDCSSEKIRFRQDLASFSRPPV